MSSKAAQQARPSLKYKDVDLPVCHIGGPTELLSGPTGRQRRKVEQRLLLKFRWPLASPLTGPARAGKLGQLLSDAGIYEGDVLAGKPQGFGRYYTDGTRLLYEGNWVKGVREGSGTLYYPSGEVYSGQWHLNKRHGLGAMTYRSGDKYEGHWHLDMRHGQAQYVSQAGDIFDGTYKNDLRDGPGTVAKHHGRYVFKGNWTAGRLLTGEVH
ncbi:hypothetical protein WJX74_008530 [Apatococcus lobatus]|uniref:MORN repeat-containing protein 3 n=1 Tax=Apatococcus lobatus TaxID=904363 RepID=A0AAW1RJR1_9CHLO